MNIQDQIKKLEQKANKYEFLKEEFDKINEKIQQAVNILSEIGNAKTGIRLYSKRTSKEKMNSFINSIREDLKVNDGKQISTSDIEKLCRENEIADSEANISKIRKALLKYEDLTSRKEGLKIFIYAK